MDPQELDHTGTFDDLLAELALTDPFAPYAIGPEPQDDEDAFDQQILGALVSP